MNYTVTVTTLTPLHIGTGDVLLRGYDFISGRDSTYVIDQDAVYAAAFERTGQAPTRPAGELVSVDQLRRDTRLVRYRLAGTTTVDEVREQIKDVDGRCYLPGSSLKGALRTAMMAGAYADGLLGQAAVNNRSKERAAERYEAAAFRPGRDDPNHDLMRTVQVADSAPVAVEVGALQLLQAQVFTGGTPSAPIWAEAVRDGVTFTLGIKIDSDLLARAELGWESRADLVKKMVSGARKVADQRIEHERRAAAAKNLGAAQAFYISLAAEAHAPRTFLIQLGWGGGWGSKTIGEFMPDAAQMELRQTFQLGRPPTWRGEWSPRTDRDFPASRRLEVADGNNAYAVPGLPLGWVRVHLEAA